MALIISSRLFFQVWYIGELSLELDISFSTGSRKIYSVRGLKFSKSLSSFKVRRGETRLAAGPTMPYVLKVRRLWSSFWFAFVSLPIGGVNITSTGEIAEGDPPMSKEVAF